MSIPSTSIRHSSQARAGPGDVHDPSEYDRRICGQQLGGTWRTDNLFADPPTWVTSSDALPSLAINTLAVSPLDPTGNTVFAGTGGTSNGGISYSNDGLLSANPQGLETGIFRSINGGQTWQALDAPGAPLYGTFIHTVLPTDDGQALANETVLAATNSGLYVSNDGGTTFGSTPTFAGPVLDVIADPQNQANGTDNDYLLEGSNDQGITPVSTSARTPEQPGARSTPVCCRASPARSAAQACLRPRSTPRPRTPCST